MSAPVLLVTVKDERGVAVAVGVLTHAGYMDVIVYLKVDGELFLGIGTQALGIDFVFVDFIEATLWRRFLGSFGASGSRLRWPGFAIDIAASHQGERADCDGERGRAEGAETFHGCLLAVGFWKVVRPMRAAGLLLQNVPSCSLADVHPRAECP